MKRCPECDFLYEDDQRLCDMDGIALVHDAHVFPDLLPPIDRAARHLWQRLAIALPLSVLAVLGFYVLNHQLPPPVNHTIPPIEAAPVQGANGAATSATTSAVVPANAAATSTAIDAGNVAASSPTAIDNKEKSAVANQENSSPPVNESENSDLKAPPADSAAAPTTKPSEKPVRSQNTPRRKVSAANEDGKDSKVATFLKKTGRILKKPFKF